MRAARLVRLAAWLLVLAIVAITLVPIGWRPIVTANASIERMAAYATLGLLLMLGYPRRWPWVLLGCVALAGSLEAAQTLTGTRHGTLNDFFVKAGASLAGAMAGLGALALARRDMRLGLPD